MNRQIGPVAISCITVLLASFLNGCEKQTAAGNAQHGSAQSAVSVPNEPTADSMLSRRAMSSASDAGAKDKMQISSTPDSQPSQQAAPSPGPDNTVNNHPATSPSSSLKPRVAAKDAYNEEKPTLLGLALGSAQNDVLAKLGTSKTKFVMDDDADPVTVFEYGDYSVGFNSQQILEFVDIHSADIDPGLHGLRLGQKAEDAFRALGKPDSNSTYVLAYKSQGTMLKLDLDPKSGTIRSIKLFPSK